MNKPAAKPLRTRGAVLYTRVSTDEQDRTGTSPETQLDACRAKALALGLPIVAEYYDPGISGGFLLSRKEFQAALADIREGRASALICPNISRYSRDVEHQQAVKKAVQAAGGALVFCDMDFADTPEGDLNFTIQGGFAEYERKNFRRRSMDGKKKRAEDGIQTCRSRPPYGYHIPTNADVLRGTYPPEQLGQYLLVEERATIVRWMFEVYAAGTHSMNQIARDLNARGVPTPGGGSFWRTSTMDNIFRNRVYKGQPVYGEIEHLTDEAVLQMPHPATGLPRVSPVVRRPRPEAQWIRLSAPPVVDEETWDRVQAMLARNRAQQGGNPARIRMLSGLVHCPHCGGKMTINSLSHQRAKDYAAQTDGYYLCSRFKSGREEIGQEECVGTRYAIQRIERHLAEALQSALECPEAIAAAFRVYSRPDAGARPSGDPRKEIAAIDQALADLGREEGAAVQAQIAGIQAGASPHVYAEVFGRIAGLRKDMEDRRGVLQASLRRSQTAGQIRTGGEPAPETVIAQALADARQVLTSSEVPGELKRRAARALVEKVVCQKEGADVYFLPGIFGGDTRQSASSGDILSRAHLRPAPR